MTRVSSTEQTMPFRLGLAEIEVWQPWLQSEVTAQVKLPLLTTRGSDHQNEAETEAIVGSIDCVCRSRQTPIKEGDQEKKNLA